MTTVLRTQFSRWHFLVQLVGTCDYRDVKRYKEVIEYKVCKVKVIVIKDCITEGQAFDLLPPTAKHQRISFMVITLQ